MTKLVPLHLSQISKSFGSVQALLPTSLEVAPGEMLALLGPSGCGKTTTLRIIAGFEIPDTGSVLIGDEDVTDLPPNKRGLGMVFQSYGLFPHMSVGDNVAYGLKMRGIARAERDERARKMLDLVRLSRMEDRFTHQLSGGQQQRVALARSLVTNPSILLLDEPLGALDKNLRERMQFELREIQRKLGITSILVTHDQEEALTMSDRVAVMEAGRVVQVGTPTDVYDQPRSRFVSEFLGTSNIFAATAIEPSTPGGWWLELHANGVRTEGSAPDGNVVPGQKVLVAVRPERLEIGPPGQGLLEAKMLDAVFRGSYFAYELSVNGHEASVFGYRQARVNAGSDNRVSVSWPAESAVILANE